MASTATSYTERQVAHDNEYMRAWANAPKRFKRVVARLGIACEPEHRDGMAIQYEENYVESSYRPNMADLVDSHVDVVIEKFSNQHAAIVRAVTAKLQKLFPVCDPEILDKCVENLVPDHTALIRSIAADLKKPMEEELIRNRAFLLGRVACYLIKEEGPKILPRVHALLHSIPGLAKGAGYGSLRASAVKCRVSAEWLRRRRDKWCHVLSIPIPTESRKSVEARNKYRENALHNHWRVQKFVSGKHNNGTNGNSYH